MTRQAVFGWRPWRAARVADASTSQPIAGTLPAHVRHATLKALLRNPSAMAGLLILTAFIGLAVFANVVFPGDPLDMVTEPLLWPGQDLSALLGSDSLGRNVAAGVAHGARVSLSVGAV